MAKWSVSDINLLCTRPPDNRISTTPSSGLSHDLVLLCERERASSLVLDKL